jgi:regulator of cell morphogenesis and NO signaling
MKKYLEKDSMSDLICEHYKILLVLSRFGIALGFGDKNIVEVCTENKVDTHTFLAVVNILLSHDKAYESYHQSLSVPSLIDYLHQSHSYFLDFRLPSIRTKLAAILGTEQHELSQAILHYFDEYVAEVRKHMMYEEQVVFPYVNMLMETGSRKLDRDNIHIFGKQHDQIKSRLTEFKNIIIKYYPAQSTNELNNVLFDIFNCENDLASHHIVEDHLLAPAIAELENKKK